MRELTASLHVALTIIVLCLLCIAAKLCRVLRPPTLDTGFIQLGEQYSLDERRINGSPQGSLFHDEMQRKIYSALLKIRVDSAKVWLPQLVVAVIILVE